MKPFIIPICIEHLGTHSAVEVSVEEANHYAKYDWVEIPVATGHDSHENEPQYVAIEREFQGTRIYLRSQNEHALREFLDTRTAAGVTPPAEPAYPIYVKAQGQLYANPETKLIGLSLNEAANLTRQGSLLLPREQYRTDICIELNPGNSARVLTCNTKTFEGLVAERGL